MARQWGYIQPIPDSFPDEAVQMLRLASEDCWLQQVLEQGLTQQGDLTFELVEALKAPDGSWLIPTETAVIDGAEVEFTPPHRAWRVSGDVA